MTSKAPEWEWEGEFECPECGEVFYFMREDGWEDMKGWVLQVYHDHTEYAEGVWRAAAYRTWPRRARPAITKAATEQKTQAWKRDAERKRIHNAET